jgi:hypothetical protein
MIQFSLSWQSHKLRAKPAFLSFFINTNKARAFGHLVFFYYKDARGRERQARAGTGLKYADDLNL